MFHRISKNFIYVSPLSFDDGRTALQHYNHYRTGYGPYDYADRRRVRRNQQRVSNQRNATDLVATCSLFYNTRRSEPVFLAPFRLYCKLVEGLDRGAHQPRGPPAVSSLRTALLQYTTGYGFDLLDSTRKQLRRAHCLVGSSAITWLSELVTIPISHIAKLSIDFQRIISILCRCGWVISH